MFAVWKEFAKEHWAKAINTAVYLLNRLPTKAAARKTPYEVWYGSEPSLENLKVFGCLYFAYVPQIKKGQLDKKTEAGFFIGYSTHSKSAYKIFQPNTKKILISRDVRFIKNDEWDWKEKQSVLFPDQVPKL